MEGFESWASYVPAAELAEAPRLAPGGRRPGEVLAARLEEVPVTADELNAQQGGSVLQAANHASARLARRTGPGGAAVAATLERQMQAGQQARQRRQTERREARAAAAAAAAMEEEEEEEEEDEPVRMRRQQPNNMIDMEFARVVDNEMPIRTLAQHARRDNQPELFAVTVVDRPHRASTEVVIQTPPAVQEFNYCAQFKHEVAWFSSYMARRRDFGLRLQDIPVIRRAVLITFERERDPTARFERDCLNLDREPQEGDSLIRCVAHRLSEMHFGPGRGYRLRELLLNDQTQRINAALAHNERIRNGTAPRGTKPIDPCTYLPNPPEMCYLCHVYLTTQRALLRRWEATAQARQDHTVPPDAVMEMMSLNKFMVMTGPGEYDRRKMLDCDDPFMCIVGNFPKWWDGNYVPCVVRDSQLRGFEESPNLLHDNPDGQEYGGSVVVPTEMIFPIAPHFLRTTHLACPSVEATLYLTKYERSRRPNKTLAHAIFTEDLRECHERLRALGVFGTDLARITAALERGTIDVEQLCRGGGELQASDEVLGELAWRSSTTTMVDTERCTWFTTVYLRVNGARLLGAACKRGGAKDQLFARKITRFEDAHLAMVQRLDREPVDDEHLDVDALLALYEPLGESHYPADGHLVTVTHREHQLRRTPLEVISGGHRWWTVEEVADAVRSGAIPVEQLTVWIEHPDGHEWNPFRYTLHEDMPGGDRISVATHTLYLSVVYLLNQIFRCLQEEDDDEVRDALWAYYAGFVDLFDHCANVGRMDDLYLLAPLDSKLSRDGTTVIRTDRPSPWVLYGATEDTRCFDAGYLPDLAHVLTAIPLSGERLIPQYDLGKICYKSYPFASGRRHQGRLVLKCIAEDATFGRIFCQMAWVMLANLYPGAMAGPFDRLAMRDLLRIRELTRTPDSLTQALSAGGPDGGGAPLVVLTVLRMHIVYMVSRCELYGAIVDRCIDFADFRRDAIHRANIIRSHSLMSSDPFAQARVGLGLTAKGPHSRVFRLRQRSLAVTLADEFNATLEKVILKSRQNFGKDADAVMALQAEHAQAPMTAAEALERLQAGTLVGVHVDSATDVAALFNEVLDVCRAAQAFYTRLVDTSIPKKSDILNELMRLDPPVRLTRAGFAMLREPRFGGVADLCVDMLCELVTVYHTKAVPREFAARIGRLCLKDFMVATFYCNMVAQLSKINFVPLDADMARRTHVAMVARRHRLFPGEPIPASIYDVPISLCCDAVCGLCGPAIGNAKVAYDMDRQQAVCARDRGGKRKSKIAPIVTEKKDGEDEDEDEQLPNLAEVALAAERDTAAEFDGGGSGDADILALVGGSVDLTGDAMAAKGRGIKHSRLVHEKKVIRNERKAVSKIPCPQAVLPVSLFGRMLVWGNRAGAQQCYLFCPECANLHIFTSLNYMASETGRYRCSECARREMMHEQHKTCAYCKAERPSQFNEDHGNRLDVLHDDTLDGRAVRQTLHFCDSHFRMARRAAYGGATRAELWKVIREEQDARNARRAVGIYKKRG